MSMNYISLFIPLSGYMAFCLRGFIWAFVRVRKVFFPGIAIIFTGVSEVTAVFENAGYCTEGTVL